MSTTIFCAGLKSEGFCQKHDQCAMYRKWWQAKGEVVEMVICAYKKHDRFVPISLEPAAAKPIQSLPVGKTMDLFA